MASEKHSIRNSVIATLAAAAILACLKFIPGLFSVLLAAMLALIRYLAVPVTVPRWLLLILCALGLIVIGRACWRVLHRRGSSVPRIADYRTDEFFGAVWRWSYYGGISPRHLAAFCPTCDTQLVYLIDPFPGRDRLWLQCEYCGTKSPDMEGTVNFFESKVARQIERIIRTGEWRNRIPSEPNDN